MSDDRQATRRLIRLLVIGGAVLVIEALLLGWWIGLIRIPEDDPRPERAAVDVDELFSQRFDVFDQAAEVIWQHEGFFRDKRVNAALLDWLHGGQWPLDAGTVEPSMTDAEKQTVLELYALEPDTIIYYAPVASYREHCRAWGVAVTWRVPDEEISWEDGWREATYLYARCEQKDHAGYPLTCNALRALLLRATMGVESWEPLDRPCWHRITRWSERR